MNKRYLNGTICTEDNEDICHLTVILERDEIFETVFFTPLNQNLPYEKDAYPLAGSYAAEAIINRFKGDENPVPHKSFTKTAFYASIFENLCKIKYGQTITYKELALMCGREKAARAVGNALRVNPLPLIYPCHRIVATNGFGGFSGNHNEYIEIKKKLLELEKKGKVFCIK